MRLDRDRARLWIDARVDARRPAAEHLTRPRRAPGPDGLPDGELGEEHLGHREVDPDDAEVVERCDDLARRDERARAYPADAEDTRERRRDDAVAKAGLRGREPCHRNAELVPGAVELLLRHEVVLTERPHALELPFLFGQTDALLLELGRLLPMLQLDEGVSLRDGRAVLEVQSRDSFRDERRDGHGLEREGRADGLHSVREAACPGGLGDDDRLSAAPASGLRLRALQERVRHEHHGDASDDHCEWPDEFHGSLFRDGGAGGSGALMSLQKGLRSAARVIAGRLMFLRVSDIVALSGRPVAEESRIFVRHGSPYL